MSDEIEAVKKVVGDGEPEVVDADGQPNPPAVLRSDEVSPGVKAEEVVVDPRVDPGTNPEVKPGPPMSTDNAGVGVSSVSNVSDVMPEGSLVGESSEEIAASCQCEACQTDGPHKSDCAVHNEPAYPNGPCSCGVSGVDAPEGEVLAEIGPESETGVKSEEVLGAVDEIAVAGLPENVGESASAGENDPRDPGLYVAQAYCDTHNKEMTANPSLAPVRWDCGAGDGMCHAVPLRGETTQGRPV